MTRDSSSRQERFYVSEGATSSDKLHPSQRYNQLQVVGKAGRC